MISMIHRDRAFSAILSDGKIALVKVEEKDRSYWTSGGVGLKRVKAAKSRGSGGTRGNKFKNQDRQVFVFGEISGGDRILLPCGTPPKWGGTTHQAGP